MDNQGIILSRQTFDRIMAAVAIVERLLGGGRRGIAGYSRRDEGTDTSVILCRLVGPLTGVGYGKYRARSLSGPGTLEPANPLDMPEGLVESVEVDVLFANLVEDGMGLEAHGITVEGATTRAWGIGLHVGYTEEGLKRVFGIAITIGCAIDQEEDG